MNALEVEKINELKRLTSAGLTQREIAKQLNISPSTVSRYTQLDKGEVPRWYCKKCSVSNPKGAKFCNQCGSKLLTDREETIQNLKTLVQLAGSLPESSRDLYINTLKSAMKYLARLED